MKPDWQNKSYAKSGSPAGPSTTHAKLKVGMSSLHSKISAANSNMPKAPKPVVRKFADGGSVRTRSDDQIWWESQPGNRGKDYPGDEIASKQYERNKAAGEENLSRLRSAAESIRSFFSRDKSPEVSSDNITGDSGMSESDIAKKQAMSGGMVSEKKAEAPAPEERRREITDYMVKNNATSDTVVQPTTTVSDLPPAPAEPPKDNKSSASSSSASSSSTSSVKANKPAAKTINRSNQSGQSQKDIERMILEKKALAGNEAMKREQAAQINEPTKKKTYRSLSGKIETYEDTPKPSVDVMPAIKKGAGAVADYFKNFETPAERRSRLAKENK